MHGKSKINVMQDIASSEKHTLTWKWLEVQCEGASVTGNTSQRTVDYVSNKSKFSYKDMIHTAKSKIGNQKAQQRLQCHNHNMTRLQQQGTREHSRNRDNQQALLIKDLHHCPHEHVFASYRYFGVKLAPWIKLHPLFPRNLERNFK